jgi:D-sedoheptulose 7-phosphate isomerase
MTFPDVRFADAGGYADAYFAQLLKVAASVDRVSLKNAADILTRVYRDGGTVYSCGNGGSAAIANHVVCDHCKLVRSDTDLTPRIYSLNSSIELVTALGNDLSYEEIFVYQLAALAKPGDALLTISSSGDSENIVRACNWAKDHDLPVISLTGFSGGRSARIADANLHVVADNYGVIEDVHQSLLHILAQFIRQANMNNELISQRKF